MAKDRVTRFRNQGPHICACAASNGIRIIGRIARLMISAQFPWSGGTASKCWTCDKKSNKDVKQTSTSAPGVARAKPGAGPTLVDSNSVEFGPWPIPGRIWPNSSELRQSRARAKVGRFLANFRGDSPNSVKVCPASAGFALSRARLWQRLPRARPQLARFRPTSGGVRRILLPSRPKSGPRRAAERDFPWNDER